MITVFSVIILFYYSDHYSNR